MFFTDNEGQYLLILTTDIGYYSKLKNAKNSGISPTDTDNTSKISITDIVRIRWSGNNGE